MDRLRTSLLLMGGEGNIPAYDAFASSIVHAYEPARRVLSSYTGSLVRLRRDSDDAEADFGYTSNNDLDTAAIASWLGAATGYVVTIYDQAPAGDDATQAVAADQPPYAATVQNGHAGIDPGDDYLQGAFTTGGALSQPFGVFVAAALAADDENSDDADRYMMDGDDGTNRMIVRKWTTPDPDAFNLYAGNNLTSSNAADDNWNIWSVLFSGASSQFWINGVSQASGDAGTNNPDGITIGSKWDGLLPWLGTIGSIVICDPSLSDAARQSMEAAMNAYWGAY